MSLSRLFLPLLLACSLLFSQQAGVMHTVSHVLAEQQNDKQTPHSHNCELCALDAQLGSALNTGFITFTLSLLPVSTWAQSSSVFLHAQSLAATARGPPASLQ